VRLALADFTLGRLPGLVRDFLLDWTVGGLVVGLALALPAFAITAALVRARRRVPDPLDEAMLEVARRYVTAGVPRGHRHYVSFKLRLDPVYRQVCALLARAPRGVDTALDLGTGLGHLPILLVSRGLARQAIGVDWDAAKIASGQRASAGLEGVTLVEGDVRSYSLPPADLVLLIDVLHYYPLEEQRATLARAASALRPGGQLLIRETDRDARSHLTRALEHIAVRCGWNRGPGLSYRTAAELRAELEAAGLEVAEAADASSSVHRGNVLICGRRP
jgi:SAM-dependent methyltransferase